MTTDEVLNRIFGKGAAKKLHKLVAEYDVQKRSKKKGKKDDR